MLNLLAKIAPSVFLAGVLLLVSWAVYTISLRVGAPEYLTWVYQKKTSAKPCLSLVEKQGDGNTSVLYQGALAGAERVPVTVWRLGGHASLP